MSEYLTKHGIQREKDYPYGKYPEEATAKSGPCKHNKTLGYATVKKVYQTPQGDELSLKKALANFGVVAIGVDAATCKSMMHLKKFFDLKLKNCKTYFFCFKFKTTVVEYSLAMDVTLILIRLLVMRLL